VTTDERGDRHRRRLLAGMTTAVARKGYAAVTIADVVADAGVSKRTFYEHFSSKQDCLLACYTEANAMMMAAVRQQIAQATGSPEEIVHAVIDTYLAFLDRAPEMTTTLLIEVQRAGAEGRRIFRSNSQRFAQLVQRTAWEETFDADQAIALLGGINALLLAHAEEHPDVPFRTITPAVRRFVQAVVGIRGERVRFP
jgi:AcrR family transcriptional regulator